jgi:uncharacterized protein YjbI with pentapeptide repeats
MDLEGSYQLLKRGVAEWNAWAEKQLAEKVRLKESGAWETVEGPNPTVETWLHNARADFQGRKFGMGNFSGLIFPSEVDFRNAHFQTNADFTQATFLGEVWFNGAEFHGRAIFFDCEFECSARFNGTKFNGATNFGKAVFSAAHFARFDQAIFADSADFLETRFHGDTSFRQTRFEGPTSFSESSFHKDANFNAIRAESAFSLANVRFDTVPDFIQAHFPEAPRLDNVQVPIISERDSLRGRTNPEAAPRYRALKRLALQGHDHDRETRFFADELRSLRHHPDKPWHARFLAGLLYESVSNFGRSISRPLLLLTIWTVSFAAIYACAAGSWACVNGKGRSVDAAIYLSVRKALVFPGFAVDRRLNTAYECLYGATIPQSVAYLEIAQTLLSAILIFLVLLATRNLFRIK